MVNLNELNLKAIQSAVNMIGEGATNRVDLKNVKVYAVGENVIRIDIKREVK